MKKTLLSIVLALTLLASYMPTGVFAKEPASEEHTPLKELASIFECETEINALKELSSFSEEGMSPDASTRTISGKITLPDGVRANSGDRVKVYAYPARVIDDGKITYLYDGAVAETFVTFSQGASFANYSISVPEGDYNIGVRFHSGRKEISGAMVYYSEDGTTFNENLSSPVHASSNVTEINLSLKKSDTYISGTLDLSANVPKEDTYVYVAVDNLTNAFYNYSYAYLAVTKGQTSVDYEIGINSEISRLRVGSDYFNSRYYSGGELVYHYEKMDALDTTESIDNLDIVLPKHDADKDSHFTYTINFSRTYDHPKNYFVSLKPITTEENWDYFTEGWITVPANTQSITSTMFYTHLPEGKVCFTYRDITGCESVYIQSDSSTLYYSEKFGVAGNVTMATDIAGLSELTVTEPNMTPITGQLSVGGDGIADYRYIYVGAEFKDETFCDRILISSGKFSINVPSRLENEEFRLFTAANSQGTATEETLEYVGTYIFGANSENIIADYNNNYSVSGTITIPVPAPENGVTVKLYSYDKKTYTDIDLATYIISPGETSVDYTVPVPSAFDPESTFIFAETEIYEKANIAPYAETDYIGNTDNYDIDFCEAVTISGTISLPDGDIASEGLRAQITAGGMKNMYVYAFSAISKGKSEAKYSITIPKGVTMTDFHIIVNSPDSPYMRNLYYDGSGFSSTHTDCKMTVAKDMTLDATLMKKSTISGVFRLPENSGYTSGSTSMWVYAESTSTGNTYSEYYEFETLTDELPFSINVSSNDTYKVYAYIYNAGDSNIVTYKQAYYAGNTTTTDQSKAVIVEANSNIEFLFPVYETISGSISFATGAIIAGSNDKGLNIDLALRPKSGGGNWQNKQFKASNTNNIPFSFPVNAGETYILSVYIYNNDGIATNLPISTYYYYNTDKSTVTQADATVISSENTIDFVIPRLNIITGKITAPENIRSLSSNMTVSAYLSRKSGSGAYSHSTKAYIDENLNYTLSFPDTLNGQYTMYLGFNGVASNILGKNYYYHTGTETQSNISISPSTDISGINISVETGYTIEGILKLPTDAELRNVVYTPRVSAGSYDSNCETLSAENPEVPFMIAVQKSTTATGTSVVLSATLSYVSRSGDWTTNMYEGRVYYIPGAGSSYTGGTTASIPVTSDISGIVFELKTAALVDVIINRPDGYSGYFSGNMYVTDVRGTQLGTASFSLQQDVQTSTARLQLSKANIGKDIYIYYTTGTTSDYIQPGKVYINPDGTYTNLKSRIKEHTLAETQTMEIKIQGPDDMVYPHYILQSDHPYKANFEKTYTYTHPDPSVKSLKVTFAEDSEMAYGASVTIYNADGSAVIKSGSNTSFTYSDLAGKSIIVSGNSFSINFKTGSNSEHYFGWAITDIEARNVIAESQHPYRTKFEYEYTHPTQVEKLAVTFDEYSKLSNYDTLYIYDRNGSLIQRASGDLRGKTIEIPGSYFKMQLNANSSTSEYGVAVTHITEAVKHNVVFLDSDGTILEEQTVYLGRPAVCKKPALTTRATDNKMQIFSGWDCESALASVRSDLYARAQYTETTGYFESAHPFSDKEETYTYIYNHKTDVDSLKISFSEKSSWGYEVAYLTVYDKNRNAIVIADEGADISGKTFTVDGDYFELEFRVPFNSRSAYGFKIDNIEAVYPIFHTLTYVDMNGRELCTRKVREGAMIPDPGIYVFEGYKNGVVYEFVDWERPVAAVTGDMTIRPIYETIEYTRIYTEEDLRKINDDLDGNYILMNDITLENPWEPIGTTGDEEDCAFSGTFDGNKHVIRNIAVSPADNVEGDCSYAGLFYKLEEAEIFNLGLEIAFGGPAEFCNITTFWGGLAATSHNSWIYSCYVSGTMETSFSSVSEDEEPEAYFGGLLGMGEYSYVTDCYTDVKFTFNELDVIYGNAAVAGFAGEFYKGDIESCYSNSSVIVANEEDRDEIQIGGVFVYSKTDNGEIWKRSVFYNKDRITPTTDSGDNYWSIKGVTSAELKDKKTYCFYNERFDEYLDDWNFWEIWHLDETVNDGFPHLGFTIKMAEFKSVEVTADEATEELVIEYDLTKVPSSEATIFVTSFVNGKVTDVVSTNANNLASNGSIKVSYDEKPDEVKILIWEDFSRLRPFAQKQEVTVK